MTIVCIEYCVNAIPNLLRMTRYYINSVKYSHVQGCITDHDRKKFVRGFERNKLSRQSLTIVHHLQYQQVTSSSAGKVLQIQVIARPRGRPFEIWVPGLILTPYQAINIVVLIKCSPAATNSPKFWTLALNV